MGGLVGVATPTKTGFVSPEMFSFSRSSSNANDCIVFGSYKIDPNTINVPSGLTYGDVLVVIPWDPNTVHQFIYTVNGFAYRRIKSMSWGEWEKL